MTAPDPGGVSLVRGRGPCTKIVYELHKRDQAALIALSGIGKHVVARRSGHHIPLDEPGLVVTAIRDVIAAARW